MRERLFMILIFALLALATVVIIGSALRSAQIGAISSSNQIQQDIMIRQEAEVFQRADESTYNNPAQGDRKMSTYYDNRAYPGAPPTITHPLLSEEGIGGKTCLQCHERGGYVARFEAYAPVSPHSDWINCRQCHLPAKTAGMFASTDWEKPIPPALGNKAISTGPLIIPHHIRGRENCLSCHAGPAAPLEIRVTHPERSNCRQCHLPQANGSELHQLIEASTGSGFNRIDTFYNKVAGSEEEIDDLKVWIDQH